MAIIDFTKPVEAGILKDKSVLVTGGASGLGALICTAFAEHGSKVTIADLNKIQGEALAHELVAKNQNAQFIQTDVTDWSSQVRAFKSAIAFSGNSTIDIVVASAGLSGAPFILPDEEPPSLDKDPPLPKAVGPTLDVNVEGAYYTSKLAQHYFGLPTGTENQGKYKKCLVLISSLAGYLEIVGADYTASKWAVRGLFRSIRSKFEDLGYRIDLIAPWVMDTPMSKNLARINRENNVPVGDANNVANAVIRCATDELICSRAIGVGAAETFDLRDDLEGLNAGTTMKEYLEGEAKGFMEFWGIRP